MKRLILLVLFLWTIVYGQSPVNLQTGAAQVNIPLYSYQDISGLSCDVKLDYFDGNGLKVSELASAVGTGWNLQAGGVIIREQRGLADDQERSLITADPSTQTMTFKDYYDVFYPQGYLYSAYSPSDVLSNEGGYVKMLPKNMFGQPFDYNPPQYGGNIPTREVFAADREQDIFHLRCNNLNVDFVIGKNKTIKVLNDSRIKITFLNTLIHPGYGRKTTISEFDVTDVNGINYTFSTEEHTTVCNYFTRRFYKLYNDIGPDWVSIADGSNPSTNTLLTFPGDATESFITTKWYLTQIKSPRTGESINFTYEPFSLDISPPGILGVTVDNTSGSINEALNVPRNIISTWRLKSIVSIRNKVDFIYKTAARVDVPNEAPLDEIQISDFKTSSLIKKYKLSYGYFLNNSIVDYNFQFDNTNNYFPRLCLQSLQEFGSDGTTTTSPYLFTYNFGNGMYVPPAFYYWTDHWGYFVSRAGTYESEIPPGPPPSISAIYTYCVSQTNSLRAPISGYAQNGIIKAITYPYGGSLTYHYEQNDAYYNNQNIVSGGVRVSTTTLYDGIDHGRDIIKQYKYLKSDETSSSGWGYEQPVYSVSKAERIYKDAGGNVGMTFKDFANSFAQDFFKSSVVNSSSLGSLLGGAYLQTIYAAIVVSVIQIIVDTFTPDHKDENIVTYSSLSNQSNNPLPFQYSRVEVIDKTLASDNGKTVYEFYSDDDYPIINPNYSFPFSGMSRYVPWAYGLLKRKAIYNSSNKLLKESINHYSVISSVFQDGNFASMKWDAKKYYCDVFPPQGSASDLGIYGNGDIVESPIYYPLIGHAELNSTTERTYSKSDNSYDENITNYTYSVTNFQLKTATITNSKGENVIKVIHYPEEYPDCSFANAMVENNMVNTPLATETWVQKPDQQKLIDATATEFATVNFDIKPSALYKLESSLPVDEQIFLHPFNSASVVQDPTFIKRQQQYVYDISGNLIQTISKGKPLTMLYDNVKVDIPTPPPSIGAFYNTSKGLLIAQVVNTNAGEFAYTSFEGDHYFGEENLENWDYNRNAVITHSCPTGNVCYQLSTENASISALITVVKPYILSYWALGSNVAVNNSSYILLKTVINPSGWTYYEYQVNGSPGNPLSPPTISGSSLIDEIRFYPADARMTTYTYDFARNKTSICDENNHIQYYKYDALNRLTQIVDESGNIIKQYQYNVKQ